MGGCLAREEGLGGVGPTKEEGGQGFVVTPTRTLHARTPETRDKENQSGKKLPAGTQVLSGLFGGTSLSLYEESRQQAARQHCS